MPTVHSAMPSSHRDTGADTQDLITTHVIYINLECSLPCRLGVLLIVTSLPTSMFLLELIHSLSLHRYVCLHRYVHAHVSPIPITHRLIIITELITHSFPSEWCLSISMLVLLAFRCVSLPPHVSIHYHRVKVITHSFIKNHASECSLPC
jgi:hypothetical protein